MSKIRHRIAKWIAGPRKAAPPRVFTREYAAARSSRLTAGWQTSNTSADAELVQSLQNLRSRSRALVRDVAYAKRTREIVVNNIIGQGIKLQASVSTTRGQMNERINDAIERAWCEWCRGDACHTGGTLHFGELERVAMGEVFEAGEVFIRKHPRAVGDSRVPLALELIEPERLADDGSVPGPVSNRVRMGIELDDFFRPVAYWVKERQPGEGRWATEKTDRIVRVPADQMFHLRVVRRWPQTRGEPWMHAGARKLNDMDGYSEAEIIAARSAASYMGFISTDDPEAVLGNEEQADGSRQMELQPGAVEVLKPGETFNSFAPNRPNSAMDPFMRLMLREFASGVGVTYESLSRDYAQSNYSSSRLALLDDRDSWRALQQWWVRSFREPLHREWLRLAVYAGAIPEVPVEPFALDSEKFYAAKFKPRGWSWIDPSSEVEAYKEAVKAGFMTISDVIAATGDGRDLEEVLRERERELALLDALGIKVDTTVEEEKPEPAPAPPAAPAEPERAFNVYVQPAQVQVPVRFEAPVRFEPMTFNVPAPVVNLPPPEVTVEARVVNRFEPELSVVNRVDPTPVMIAAPEIEVEDESVNEIRDEQGRMKQLVITRKRRRRN